MVLRAALELFHNRNFSGVVAVCQGALTDDSENVHLRMLLARALLALRLDADAQQELSECLRYAPRNADAYRLLGELALRNDELKSAEIFVRESLRLEPAHTEAADLLEIIRSLYQPTAAVEKLPAATAAVGCPSPPPLPKARRKKGRFPLGTHQEASANRAGRLGRFGRKPAPPRDSPWADKQSTTQKYPKPGVATSPAARAAKRVPRPTSNARRFGEYLVEVGALTGVELKAALAYHRFAGVRVGAAAAALGFISEPKVEWAAHGFHGTRKR